MATKNRDGVSIPMLWNRELAEAIEEENYVRAHKIAAHLTKLFAE